MTEASVSGLFRGAVQVLWAPDGKLLTTAIRKQRCSDILVLRSGVAGDESARPDHRTLDRAVHVFSCEGYRAVEARLQRHLDRPAFGENILAEGLTEEAVFVGDIYQIGNAAIKVTQPTERCNVVGRAQGIPKLLKTLHEAKVCGFYASVVGEGGISCGAQVHLLQRSQKEWSIRKLHDVMFSRIASWDCEAVLELKELSVEWKNRLRLMRGRALRGEPVSSMLVECGALNI
jgi:MOSC domain-containing protein YiiM